LRQPAAGVVIVVPVAVELDFQFAVVEEVQPSAGEKEYVCDCIFFSKSYCQA